MDAVLSRLRSTGEYIGDTRRESLMLSCLGRPKQVHLVQEHTEPSEESKLSGNYKERTKITEGCILTSQLLLPYTHLKGCRSIT